MKRNYKHHSENSMKKQILMLMTYKFKMTYNQLIIYFKELTA
jgi:hypothetical protein